MLVYTIDPVVYLVGLKVIIICLLKHYSFMSPCGLDFSELSNISGDSPKLSSNISTTLNDKEIISGEIILLK